MKLNKLFFTTILSIFIGSVGLAKDYAKELKKDTIWYKRKTNKKIKEFYEIYNGEDPTAKKAWIAPSFRIDLGFNNFIEGESTGETLHKLSFAGSRYFALAVLGKIALGDSPFRIKTGLEGSWNNFMFEGKNFITQEADKVSFATLSNTDVIKNKLSVVYLSVPVMLEMQQRNKDNKKTLNLGIGGYIGYKVLSYSKLTYQQDDKKLLNKEYNDFFLQNIRYGVEAQIGYRAIKLFCKYDLNSLFLDQKGPKLNVINFGLRFF